MTELRKKTKEELISEILVLQKRVAELAKNNEDQLCKTINSFSDDQMFSLLAETSTSAILVYDFELVRYVNSAAAQMTGDSKRSQTGNDGHRCPGDAAPKHSLQMSQDRQLQAVGMLAASA